MPRALGLSLLVACVVVQVPEAGTLALQATKGRSTIVISDLHMGVGRDAAGAWHRYEDFRWGVEFADFLKAIDAEGGGATDLILNGDTFELLQGLDKGCTYADASLGCTEPEALARLERVLAAHQVEMKALAGFARAGSNRIVFVPGDHDAGLLFPSVGRRLAAAVGAPPGRVEVAAAGHWLSADGKIYAEHGHQMEFSASKHANWPAPFVLRDGREHLVRPWGEQLLAALYNHHELTYPIVDNLAEERAGVKFGLAAAGVTDAGETAARLLRYVLFAMSWPQFRTDMEGAGGLTPPTWDVGKVREEGPAFLVASLPDDDRFKPLAAKALSDGRLAKSMSDLSDVELAAICDYRAAVRRARRRLEQTLTQLVREGLPVAECPRTPETRGAAFTYFWGSRDLPVARRLEAAQKMASRGGGPIAVFLYGHTHLPDLPTYSERNPGAFPDFGYSPVRNATTPATASTGAWQRTVTPNQLDAVKKQRGVSDAELLGSVVQLEDLPPCYSFVQIRPYDGTPAPTARYWYQPPNEAGKHMAGNCNRRAVLNVSPVQQEERERGP